MAESHPNRQSIRLRGWDYTTPGWYFVTINTHDNAPLFGAIVNGCMVLSAAGQVAERCWREVPIHFSAAQTDAFIIMPNHMHGLLRLIAAGEQSPAPALGDVVGAYKAAVSRTIGRGGQLPARPVAAGASPIWHRNYWDVIVRDEQALANIRQYIRLNPQNYHAVIQAGAPRFLGDCTLLTMPKVGFLASRGKTVLPGKIPLRKGEAILSGFLSPMERSLFQAGLKHAKPMIWVRPWGLAENFAPDVRAAIAGGRLLLISPFDDCIETPSVRRAVWCNQYVLTHCSRLVVGHLNPDGMLACVLSEAVPGLEVSYL